MTTKRIVYATPDGVHIIMPNRKNRRPDETEAQFLARVWARQKEVAKQITSGGAVFNPHLTDKTEHAIVEAADLPQDYAMRDSWRLVNGKVVVGG